MKRVIGVWNGQKWSIYGHAKRRIKEVAGVLRAWGKMKYGSICEKVEQLKLEVKQFYKEEGWLGIEVSQTNLEILQLKNKNIGESG